MALTAEVSAGDRFEKSMGGGLVFRLTPTRLGPTGQLDGWEMTIVSSTAADDDYIYPVTPPLRFNGVQILGPSYGEDTRAALGRPHAVRFLLSRADYDRLSPLLLSALWPYSAPRPDQAGDEYVAALKTLTTGSLDLTVLSYDEDPATSSLRRMKFRAEFTAPRDFGFAPELKPRPATCPGPFGH